MAFKRLGTPLAAVICLLAGTVCAMAEQSSGHLEISAPYQKELYDLAFQVFMANSNLSDAMMLAEKALASRPGDREWRRRAAQLSEWSGNPLKALEHWAWLAEHGDADAMSNALRIARQVNDFSFRKRLLEKMLLDGTGDQVGLFKEYLAVVEGAGTPEDALALIKSGRIRLPVEKQLYEEARLADSMGRSSEALAAYGRLSSIRPLTHIEAMRAASIWYGQGNAGKAWEVLKGAASNIKPEEDDFWRTFADLAWARQDEGETIRAAAILASRGKALEQDYQRLLLIYGDANPSKSYSTAVEAWRKYRKPLFFHSIFSAGMTIGKGKELVKMIRSLSEGERKALASDGLSWIHISSVLRFDGDDTGALAAAWAAVRIEPRNPDIALAYAWLLIDMKRIGELKRMLPKWEASVVAAPVMKEPLAAAYMLMGESGKALDLFRSLLPYKRDDPAWLASYADVLEQANHPEEAWEIRRRAFIMLSAFSRGIEKADRDKRRKLLQTRMQIVMHLLKGDRASALARRVAGYGKERYDLELVMAWAMSTANTDLARLWYWKKLAHEAEKPEWAMLGLALEENDRVAIAALIEMDISRLPYRDAVEGALRAGMIPTAETHGFEKQQQNINDHLVDQQVREMFNSRPGYFNWNMQLDDVGGIGLLENRFVISQPLTKSVWLSAGASDREAATLKRSVTGIIPKRGVEGFVAGGTRFSEGQMKVQAGIRDSGVARYPFGALSLDYRPYRFLGLAADMKINSRADETALMTVAGTRDRLSLSAAGEISGKESAALELGAARFHDNWHNYLGEGLSTDLVLRHQFTRAWPDYSARIYAGYHHYSAASGGLDPRTALMLPQNSSPLPSTLIPASFWQAGLGISLGQTWKNTYSRDWKPFMEIDLGWMSTADFGYRLGAGLVGPLFGLDQLRMGVTHGSGKFGGSEMTTTIEFDYRYLF